MTYAWLTEYRDEKEVKKLDRELSARPGVRPSHGTKELMAAFGMATT